MSADWGIPDALGVGSLRELLTRLGHQRCGIVHCTLSASDAPLEWLLTPAVIDTGLDRKTLAGLLRGCPGE
jgi:hypothetical protein